MTIEFTCECGEVFQVEDEFAGRKGRCPTCKRIMVVPEPSKEQEPLELQEELQEGPQVFEQPRPHVFHKLHSQDLPSGKRVEEEVEILRGWDTPGMNEDQIYTGPTREPGPWSLWKRIPRPILMAIPGVVAVGLLVLWLAKPADRKGGHPTVDRTPKPGYSEPQSPTTDAKPGGLPGPVPPITASPPETSPKETRDLQAAASPQSHASQEKGTYSPLESRVLKEEAKTSASVQKPPPAAASKEVASLPKEAKDKGSLRTKDTKPPPASQASPRPPATSQGDYTVNVGAFKSQGMADALAEVLRKKGLDPFVWSTELKKGPGKMYRVSVGRFPTRRQADQYAKELKEKHGLDA